MANDLFFFISTLPTLKRDEKPFYSHAEFIEQCREQLSPETADALAALSLDPAPATEGTGADAFANAAAWRQWVVFTKNCIVKLRAGKLKRSADEYLKPTDALDPFVQKQIEDAFAIPAPAEREAAIDAIKWNYLESLASQHIFDFDALVVYALKLLLLEKSASRSFDKGLSIFDSMVKTALEQANNTRI